MQRTLIGGSSRLRGTTNRPTPRALVRRRLLAIWGSLDRIAHSILLPVLLNCPTREKPKGTEEAAGYERRWSRTSARWDSELDSPRSPSLEAIAIADMLQQLFHTTRQSCLSILRHGGGTNSSCRRRPWAVMEGQLLLMMKGSVEAFLPALYGRPRSAAG